MPSIAPEYKDIPLATGIVYNITGVMSHWTITEVYLKTSNETETVLSKKTKDVNQQNLAKTEHDKFIFRLKLARWVVLVLAVGIEVLFYFGFKGLFLERDRSGLLYFISLYSDDALIFTFLIIWGWTLIRLYRDIVNAKELKQILPNKNFFVLHATLLVLFLVVDASNIIAD